MVSSGRLNAMPSLSIEKARRPSENADEVDPEFLFISYVNQPCHVSPAGF